MAELTRRQVAEMLARKTLRSGSFSQNFNYYNQVLRDGEIQHTSSIDDKTLVFKDELYSLKGLDSNDYNTLRLRYKEILTASYQNNYYHDPGGLIDYLTTYNLVTPPDNVSQYMTFTTSSINIDPIKLNEVLNTDIFELLPEQLTRQNEIDRFFQAYFALRPSSRPPFCLDETTGAYTVDLGPVNCDGCDEGYTACGNQETYDDWRFTNDISYDEETNEDEFITRLNTEANSDNQLEGTVRQTLQWIHNDLSGYLEDVLNPPPDGVLDTRPEYEHQSDGYLEIRNLNQAVIIKKGEGPNIGVGKSLILNEDDSPQGSTIWSSLYGNTGYQNNVELPYYLYDGFTITMWVKFLDKVNGGTLFNFGNPTRDWNPHGFKLETFVVNQDDYPSYINGGPNSDYFTDNNYERFIRLVVREKDYSIRDSHVGTTTDARVDTKNIEGQIYNDMGAAGNPSPFSYTRVPINFDEWYFVVASYNPLICEDSAFGGTPDQFNSNQCSDGQTGFEYNSDFWKGNITPPTTYTHKSGYGAKCKVEIISKTDLVRARGYKPIVEEE